MHDPNPRIRVGSEEVHGRHVLVLVDGRDDTERLLGPFVVDGFAEGSHEVHVVDPRQHARHLAWLATSGVDVPDLTRRGQLEVLTSDEAFLVAGRFERRRALAWLRQVLTDGNGGPGLSTRMIASMDWAANDVVQPDNLIAFERGLDQIVEGLAAVVVCVYDLRDHGAARVADILGVHQVSVVRGLQRSANVSDRRAGARERILATAARRFHESGIRATGVDSIIEEAGVAKASFYRHFPSKDDLVVAWLGDSRARWFDRIRAQAEASAADPGDRILLFFEATAEWLETEGFRGCPYLNTSVEIPDPSHPARFMVQEFLDEVQEWLRSVLTAARFVDAELLAMELHALLAGSISLAVARNTGAFALAAREAAGRLLADAERRPIAE
jgi:AcrR family transcriptional regulator